MSGIIKQQILKRLSKFTKNLSADQISLSAMKGEGDLSNLELDEVILTELLGAPPWMKLNRAFCNRLTIKILDEVNIDMETCDPRGPSSENSFPSYSPGKYGYTEQIMDGISLSINVININFKSVSFHATFQMSRVTVESRTPLWQAGSLDKTRIKNELRGEVVIFKEIQWLAVRIEANALADWMLTTPLRLIANQSKIRITLRKRMIDCSVVTSKVEVNMDDVLWVLTDSQVFAALTFVDDLRNIIMKNKQAPTNLPSMKSGSNAISNKSPSTSRKPLSLHQQNVERFFEKLNESSYHFLTGRVELHLCDDISQESSNHRCKVKGGAMQLVLSQLEFSYYPQRQAGSSRQGWPKYNDYNSNVEKWMNKLFHEHLQHPLNVADAKDGKHHHQHQQYEITECCMVIKLLDICLYRVSSSNDNKRSRPRKFFSSDKKRLLLPDDMPTFHVEYTEYFCHQQLPASLHVAVNPVCLSFDYPSLLWINTFALNVAKKAEKLPKRKPSASYVNVKVECLMPRITIPACESSDHCEEDLLQIQTSKLLITNLLDKEASFDSSAHVLAKQFNAYKTSRFHKHGFSTPSAAKQSDRSENYQFEEGEEELPGVNIPPFQLPQAFIETITRSNNIRREGEGEMWCVCCSQFWMDFLICNKQSPQQTSHKFKTQNFLESFPLTVWAWTAPVNQISEDEATQAVTCLACVNVNLKAMMDCNQIKLLIKIADSLTKTNEEILSDAATVDVKLSKIDVVMNMLLVIPKFELSLILPASTMVTSSSSSSNPLNSSSSSSSLSSNARQTEMMSGLKPIREQQVSTNHNKSEDSIASGESRVKSFQMRSESKDDSSLDVFVRDSSSLKSQIQNAGSHLNHFLDLPSLKDVNKQTKDTMTSMLSEISSRLRNSDSHINDEPDDDAVMVMILSEQQEVPAFQKSKSACDENDFDDVISESSSNKKKVISVLSVCFHSIEMLVNDYLQTTKIMVMVDQLSTNQIDQINFEKFKTTYLLGDESSSISLETSISDESKLLKLFFESSRKSLAAVPDETLVMEVRGWRVKLNSSTVTKLMKGLEDNEDKIAESHSAGVLKLHMQLNDVGADIVDKSENHQITVDSLKITRGIDGEFHVGAGGFNRSAMHHIKTSSILPKNDLEQENASLKKQLEKLGKLTICGSNCTETVNHWKEKCHLMEIELQSMDENVLRLNAERDSLLKLVDTLQSDLEASEKLRIKTPGM